MGLNVKAYPGFNSFVCIVPSSEFARGVALAMIGAGRHFYAEPYPDDKWMFKVDAEHEAFLRQLAGS